MPTPGVTSHTQSWRATPHVGGWLTPRCSPESARSVHVLVSRSDFVHCAERVARAWGALIHVVPPDELRERANRTLASPRTSLLVVSLKVDLDDHLLLDMLASVDRFVASEEPWESVPEFAFLTGRDVGEVTGLCERLLRPAPHRDSAARFIHVQASADSAEIVAWETDPHHGERADRVVVGAEQLFDLVHQPATVIAYQTHGGEACARGGGGVVLCGRAAHPAVLSAGTPGILACGRDMPCPRGPLPVPLRELRSPIFLLASCNGLRLADSALTEDFNLGLSFLNGAGQAYVSSISGTRGNELASRIFLAAVSSGASVGEATALINAALIRTGTDVPAFIAVGSPMLVASPDRPRPTPIRVEPTAAGILEIDAGHERFVDLLIEDERVQTMVDRDALLLSAAEPGPEVLWFSRPEVVSSDTGRPPRRQVRLFLFRLTEPIGKLRLEVGDRRRTRDEALRWLPALGRWLERWRTFGLATREAEAYAELRGAYDDAGATLSLVLARLDGSTRGRALLDAHCAVIQSLAQVAAAELTAELAARLRATFWLTNEDAASYQLYETLPHVCNACGRPGVERRIRNPVTSDARAIKSCCRCGIVFDGQADGYLRELRLRAPEVVPRGSRFALEIEVEVEPAASGQTLSVHPCLTTHVLDQVTPEPSQACVTLLSGGRQVLTFNFDVPLSLVPHQHFIKVIAATEQELVFASRLLFVE